LGLPAALFSCSSAFWVSLSSLDWRCGYLRRDVVGRVVGGTTSS